MLPRVRPQGTSYVLSLLVFCNSKESQADIAQAAFAYGPYGAHISLAPIGPEQTPYI